MRTVLSVAIVVTITVTLILLAFLLVGCTGEYGIVMPNVKSGGYPSPASPDQLMANFVVAYGTRDLEGYAATLHPDFVFETTPVATAGGERETWDRAEELRIAANMFSGESRVKDGVVVPGITQIEFIRCVGLGAWEPVSVVGVSGEALRRAYSVNVRFLRAQGSDLYVRGTCVFTVVAVASERPDGQLDKGYQILHWRDQTDIF